MSVPTYITVSPHELRKNEFNTNIVSPDNESKLDESVKRLGMFKPVICRRLSDGSLEIIGGEHRVGAALRLGYKEIPVIDLGEIDDKRAKEISLVDNGRYGVDDTLALAGLLEELGNVEELSAFLPYTNSDLTAVFSSVHIDLDELDLDGDEYEKPKKVERSTPEHQMMRFKVPVEDAEYISDTIESVMKSMGFTEEDSLTNAGDALVHIVRSYGSKE